MFFSIDFYFPSRYSKYINIAIKSAVIIVSTLPIIILYPFLQKYFVKGLTVGGVKG